MSSNEKKKEPAGNSVEAIEGARDRQIEAIKEQYGKRIEMLEKERDARLQGVERSFQHQLESTRSAMERAAAAEATKH